VEGTQVSRMKILFIARPDLFKVRGGDTVQMEQTAIHLRKLGVAVDIHASSSRANYTQYDLVHFFNIMDPEDILGHVYRCKIPYVVSPVFVDYREYDSKHRKDATGYASRILPANTIEYMKTAGKFLLKGETVSTRKFFVKGHRASIRTILAKAACLLPNSNNEYERVTQAFGTQKHYVVVPNAVDPLKFRPDRSVKRDLVICVGRLEGRKNQLNLIKAMSNTQIQVIIIGQESENQKRYVNECHAVAGTNISFVPFLSQDDLLPYYNRAKVHVLPSWFETTGLSSLEAGAMGCNLVVGDRGDVREYFSGHAEFCDPGSVDSIRNAVIKAYEKPADDLLSKHILNNFTWDKAAQKTLEAYKSALNK
jgi:glycosyltransferase involved in cell wall biosynthesis